MSTTIFTQNNTNKNQNPNSRKIYHICLSAKNEVMFRSQEDYNRAFNYYALALYKTNSIGLADVFMSNHLHIVVQTSQPDKLMYSFRNSYSKYFNRKYCREGRLGEKKAFCIELSGLYHIIAAISYVLRNPLHHGVSPTAFGYTHSSINSIFKNELGKAATCNLLPKKSYYKYLGQHTKFPQHFIMTNSGIFLRECVNDIQFVENIFTTPRAFNYYMTRRSGEEWSKEQEDDNNGKSPITLQDIEAWAFDGENDTSRRLKTLLQHENGRENYKRVSDIELCTRIDQLIQNYLKNNSVYTINPTEKQLLEKLIAKEYFIKPTQLRRCLVM